MENLFKVQLKFNPKNKIHQIVKEDFFLLKNDL